jgi:Skp family chaperone for outer membrane proteins
MKRILVAVCGLLLFLSYGEKANSQAIKIGVFDIDLMVQAMPGYRVVDSLVQRYEADSLAVEYEYYQSEFHRLDSTYKADSAMVASGKKAKALLDFTVEERRKMGLNLVYWQQIAQNKSNGKRSQYAQPLYSAVANAYKKVLDRKKYTIVLKPQTYEAGFAIDNIFIAVARELKLSGLPQELLYLGNDPDPIKQPATKAPTSNKPKTNQ